MDTQTVVLSTNPAIPSSQTQPQEPSRSLLWSGISNFLGAIFRPKKVNEVEQLRNELLVTKTRNECLEEELNRNKEKHKLQKDQLNAFFFQRIKNREQSIDVIRRDCMTELDNLFQRHDAVKRDRAQLTETYGNLQRNIMTLEHEVAIVREVHARLSQDKEKLYKEQEDLLEKGKWDFPLLQNALQDSGFVQFANLG